MKQFFTVAICVGLCGWGLFWSSTKFAYLPQNKPGTIMLSPSAPTRSIASSSYCFLCQFPPLNFSESSSKKACTDLHSAICNPSNPFLNSSEKENDKNQDNMNRIRDKGAQALGYKNFDDGLKQRLKDAGIQINSNMPPEVWEEVKASLMRPSGGDNPEHISSLIFPPNSNCEALNSPPEYGRPRVPIQKQLSDMRRKLASDYKQNRSSMIQYYKNDISGFLEIELSAKCNLLNHDPESFEAAKNKEFIQTCQNFRTIRKEALDLFRIEGTPDYEKRALNFLNKYFPTQPIVMSTPDATRAGGPTEKIYNEMASLHESYNLQCRSTADARFNVTKKIAQDYAREVQTTRTHVETTISTVYSERREKTARESLNLLRADIQSMIPKFTSDRTKQSKIIEEYNKVELFWLKNPTADAYNKNSRGVETLKRARNKEPNPSETASLFSDPTLSFFNHANAYYTPRSTYGSMNSAEQVNIFPGFLNLIDTNPFAFSSILAHELGHKIGPEISKLNDHDMKPEFSALLACYKDRKSIRLLEHQEDEAIADFVSSEVMAHQVSKLPASQRRAAVMAMASPFCEGQHDGIMCKEDHPEGAFRINGILASNPKIQQAMGCTTSQSNFKQCGLGDLASESLEMSSEGESQPQQDQNAGGIE